MFIFLLLVLACNFNSIIYTAASAAASTTERREEYFAPDTGPTLSDSQKLDHINAIYQIRGILSKFLAQKYQGVEIKKNEDFFSGRLNQEIILGGPNYYGQYPILDRGIAFYAPMTVERAEGYFTDNSGITYFASFAGEKDEKYKVYGLGSPWGTIRLFKQIDDESAKKIGPDKFENQLFSTLRKDLKLEFIIDRSSWSDYEPLQEKTIYEIEGHPLTVSKEKIEAYAGSNKYIKRLKKGVSLATGKPFKHIYPASYDVTKVGEVSLPRHTVVYWKYKTTPGFERYYDDFSALSTDYKKTELSDDQPHLMILQRFARRVIENRSKKRAHVEAAAAPAGGAGSGVVE